MKITVLKSRISKNRFLKITPSLFIVPLLILATGCSTRVSNGYGYDYGHHASVNVHGHGSAAGVVGALIVGGLIGAAIADSKQREENQSVEKNPSANTNSQDELVNGYSIDSSQNTDENEYQTALADRSSNNQSSNQSNGGSKVQWYQYGKDGNCYLMGVDKGVTDVISAVPNNQCGE